MFDCHFLVGVNFCSLDCPSLLMPWIFINVLGSDVVQKVSVHETVASFHIILDCIAKTEDFGLDGVKVYTGMIAMGSVDLCHPQEYMQQKKQKPPRDRGVCKVDELSGLERNLGIKGPASMVVHCPVPSS